MNMNEYTTLLLYVMLCYESVLYLIDLHPAMES